MKKVYIILIVSICVFSATENFAQDVAARQRMMGQIQLLLNEKASRTPAQRKMDSHLLQAAREQRGQQMAVGVNLAPSRINTSDKGLVEVDINAEVNDALIRKIESLGGKILFPSREYHTIRAAINLSTAETIAGFAEVKFIQAAVLSNTAGSKKITAASNTIMDIVTAVNNDLTATFKQHSLLREEKVRRQLQKYLLDHPSAPFTGTINSEGSRAHRTDEARTTFGFEGQGIKIGVLSDSYNKLGGEAADISSGNLPGIGNLYGNTTPVTVVQDNASSTARDEGRAMLQIIHDIAPKAQLFFATGETSEAGFANNIKALYDTYHCDIIIDDIFYYDEPVFQDGIVAQAVNYVTNRGVLYFSSAGNEGSLAKGTSGYYEGDFNDAGSVFMISGNAKTGSVHNFGTTASPVNGDIITKKGDAYTLNWSDPAGASNNDYDLFLVSASGMVKASSTTIQNGTTSPYEYIMNSPALVAGDRLVVFKTATAQVRAFALNTIRGTLTVKTNGQTHGHATAADAFGIAAAPAYTAFQAGAPTGPYPLGFSTSTKIENFSSDGPRRIFYNADGSPITAGNVLFGTVGGTVRNKPDFTAADGVSTTLAANSGLNPFFGTSAAAPHAGAIAALLKSANPSLTIADIRQIFTSTALDIESAGYDVNSGYGVIQAFQAMQALNPTSSKPDVSFGTTCPANITTKTDAGKCTAVVTYAATIADNYHGVSVTYNPASGSVFPIGTTPVTVTAKDTSGNQKTCSFNVTVTDGQLPVITGQPFDTTVCVGQNAGATVTVTNPGSFQWQINTGSGFTNITGATGNVLPLNNVSSAMNGNLYRVIVGGACSSVTTVPAKLIIVPIPTVTLAASPLTSLKPGETTTITATTTPATGGTLLWERNNHFITGAASNTLSGVTVDGIGTYKVVYTNVCTVSSQDLVISATASDNMFMYPNPTNGRFQLRYYTPANELLTLTISDLKGARVYRRQVTTNGPYTEIGVDISRNASGMYAVELRNKNNVVVGVKQIVLAH